MGVPFPLREGGRRADRAAMGGGGTAARARADRFEAGCTEVWTRGPRIDSLG
jgi:hypothetical protein